jgi:phage shock protein A
MRLIQRLTDILSANLSELVEKYEDPELLLKQALRKMEQSIAIALEDASKVVAHEKLLARQLSAEESAVVRWREHAEVAVRRGDDQAARDALHHKRDRETASASLAGQLDEVTRAGQALRRQIESMRLRVEKARRKLVLLSARNRAAHARKRLLRELSAMPAGEAAFEKFERMCHKVERTEAEADALAELAGDFGPRQEPASVRFDAADAVEAELRELKGNCA